MNEKQYVRKIFKVGSNGKTSSDVVTIPKKIIQKIDLEGKKVTITLNADQTITITAFNCKSSKKETPYRKESSEQVPEFATW